MQYHVTLFALNVSCSLYCVTSKISHGVDAISPGCGVQASLLLFFIL